jgi:hypothetical protein
MRMGKFETGGDDREACHTARWPQRQILARLLLYFLQRPAPRRQFRAGCGMAALVFGFESRFAFCPGRA